MVGGGSAKKGGEGAGGGGGGVSMAQGVGFGGGGVFQHGTMVVVAPGRLCLQSSAKFYM